MPRDIVQKIDTIKKNWTTDLRYEGRMLKVASAETFLDTAEDLIQWADGRI